jgi:3-dehydroquinate synthase/2-deoxy-scyllo-inosose synthase
MESISFVFADRAKVPGWIGIDVQDEVIGHILEMKPDKILLVCDAEAEAHHPEYFKPLYTDVTGETGSSEAAPQVEKMTLPAGDEAKSWDNLSKLMRWAFDVGATKGSVVVAFGGGALINVAGLFASILYRGSKLVYIPTTFLAMHDVVTSLKTSICFDGRKNNIGSFYAPLKTLIDLGFCRTLPRKELFSGLGELAKNALLLGGKHADGFVAALSKEQVDGAHGSSGDEFMMDDKTLMTLTQLGIDAKMKILEHDAYEKNTGMVFEYGHTVSHAIEKAYGDGVIPHGLGVTYGMLSSSYAAERLGIMSPEDRKHHDAICWLLLKRWPLPEPRPTVERVMKFAMRDSKRGITSESDDEISDVLLNRVGEPVPTPTHNLSKFPAKYVSKWLYSMGFPHEDDGLPGKQHGSKSVSMEEMCKDLLDTIRTSSDSDLVGLGFEPLTVGFANHVWGIKKNACQAVVAKRYTDLAFLRLDAEAIGSVDVHCGMHGVGPTLHYSSPQGLVMERIEGRTLTETDMHKGDTDLLEKVAGVLAKLHQLKSPPAFEPEPMLWRTMDRMLDAASRKPELWAPGVPSMDVILKEVREAKSAVENLDLPVVLCHGDFKPSNVIQTKVGGDIKFIDHELGGPNYRAFDLMKIFRTGEKASDSCMRHFLRSYLTCSGTRPSDDEVNALMRETKSFECLTWLEALCFFLALPQFRPTQTSRWNELALDRWEKFEATKHMLLGKVAGYV